MLTTVMGNGSHAYVNALLNLPVWWDTKGQSHAVETLANQCYGLNPTYLELGHRVSLSCGERGFVLEVPPQNY